MSLSIELTECDEMFNFVRLSEEQTWLAGAGEGTVISPRRRDRQGQLCTHWERNTHGKYRMKAHTHTCSSSTLLSLLLYVPIYNHQAGFMQSIEALKKHSHLRGS